MLRLILLLAAALPCLAKTVVTILGDQFFINGKPTYPGRTWNGHRIEGLLMNSRMVQATYDDLNPETVKRWAYKDTGKWDAGRNVREFLAALPEYRKHGLLAVTVNFQGGSPEGYSKAQPWHNSAIEADGSLRADYLGRMKRVIDKSDSLGMAVILGIFYFGQDERLRIELAEHEVRGSPFPVDQADHRRRVGKLLRGEEPHVIDVVPLGPALRRVRLPDRFIGDGIHHRVRHRDDHPAPVPDRQPHHVDRNGQRLKADHTQPPQPQ